MVGRDRAPQLGAEREDEVHAAGRDRRCAEAAEGRGGRRQVDIGAQVELDELVGDGALREDPELRNVHDWVGAYYPQPSCRRAHVSANGWPNLP